MDKAILLVLLILKMPLIYGQDIRKEYFDNLKIADSLYKLEDYKKSAEKYSVNLIKVNAILNQHGGWALT